MKQTTLESLEQRVESIERTLALRSPTTDTWKDWRQAVGRFVPSDISEEVDAAGRDIREADRRQAAS